MLQFFCFYQQSLRISLGTLDLQDVIHLNHVMNELEPETAVALEIYERLPHIATQKLKDPEIPQEFLMKYFLAVSLNVALLDFINPLRAAS